METTRLRWMLRLLLFNAAVLVLVSGCATQKERSFNQDYNQNLPSSPNYAVENINDTRFKLTIQQGTSLAGPQPVIYMKQADDAVAET